MAHDTARTLHARAARPNLFIKVPGTGEGLPAIEEAIFSGVPVNVTLLFSSEQYTTAAEAYLKAIERRIEAGLNPSVASVAPLFVSRWDVAVANKVPEHLHNRLGIAIAGQTLHSYEGLLASKRLQRFLNAGARAQRLLFGSTGTKDPKAADTLDVEGLAAPFTINTMPEATLKAFDDHGAIGSLIPARAFALLAEFADANVDTNALATQLQDEGAASFSKSWKDLMACVAGKSRVLQPA